MFEGQYDRTRYDFDATRIKEPKYEFADVFSSALMNLNLKNIVEQDATLEVIEQCAIIDTVSRMVHCG